MNRHVAGVHERKKPFKCQLCDALFSQGGTLNKHVAVEHERKDEFDTQLYE